MISWVKKLNRGFKSKEQTSRLNKISASLAARQNCIKEEKEREGGLSSAVYANDHTYHRSTHSERDADVPIEGATQRFTDENNWREGRIIVELNIYAQGLSGCKKCGVPLQLSHAIGIKTPGLSALLKVSIFTIVYNARSQCNLIKIRSLIFFSVSIVATRGATIEKEGADQLPDFNQIGSQ